MAVNQDPSLRRSPGTSKQGTDDGEEEGQADEEAEEEAEAEEEEEAEGKGKGRANGKGKGRAKKEGRAKKGERLRRNTECDHLERICFLFGAPRKGWTKKDALGLGELISLSVDAANHLPISSQPSFSSSTAPTCSRPVSSRSACRLERTLFIYLNISLPSDFTGHLFWVTSCRIRYQN